MSEAAILCVDDEAIVLKSLEIELQKTFGDEYLYEFAEAPSEALEIIEEMVEDDVRILIIVSDWLMPGMRGDEFLVQVHEKHPNIIKIMLTGQADAASIERAKQEADLYCCVDKPWDSQDLMERVRTALAQPE